MGSSGRPIVEDGAAGQAVSGDSRMEDSVYSGREARGSASFQLRLIGAMIGTAIRFHLRTMAEILLRRT